MECLAASSPGSVGPAGGASLQPEYLERDSNESLKLFQPHFGGDGRRGRFWLGQASAPETQAVTNMADKDQGHYPRQPMPFLRRQHGHGLQQEHRAIGRQNPGEIPGQKWQQDQKKAKKRRDKIGGGTRRGVEAKLFRAAAAVIAEHFAKSCE